MFFQLPVFNQDITGWSSRLLAYGHVSPQRLGWRYKNTFVTAFNQNITGWHTPNTYYLRFIAKGPMVKLWVISRRCIIDF